MTNLKSYRQQLNRIQELAGMTNLDQLVEWGDFAPRHMQYAAGKYPTRRVGKRLILEGKIPGRIIDGRPWVFVHRFAMASTETPSNNIQQSAIDLLGL